MDVDMRNSVYVFLLLLETVTALTGLDSETSLNLDCTNDYDRQMSCDFEAQNCSVYNMSLQSNNGNGIKHCAPMQCSGGRCCCSVKILAIPGESHTAGIWKGGQMIESKIVDISESIKPKVPEIISVEEVNGKFLVKWKPNMQSWFANELTASVMYHRKGHTEKVIAHAEPTTINGLSIYEIDGRNLEPSTMYVVSVKSFTYRTNRFSDSSQEFEFTTPASSKSLSLAIIISLSIASILLSSFIFGCFVKLKTKWWDAAVKFPNPKLLLMHPYEQAFLKPELLITSSVSVEPLISDDCKSWSKGSLSDSSSDKYQQSSGISSSSLIYVNAEPTDIKTCVNEALIKALTNIVPMPFLGTNQESHKDSGSFSSARANHFDSGSFENKTYSILIPCCSHQSVMDNPEVQTQAPIFCDSSYHPSEADITVTIPDQLVAVFQPPNLPVTASSLLATDMSYQQCKPDSGQLSCAEDSGLSSDSSGAHTMASYEAGVQAEVVSWESKPSGQSQVEETGGDTEQAFQKVVEQSGPERQDSFNKLTPGSSHTDHGGQCLSELQRNLFLLIAAEKPVPIIANSGYQSV